MIVAILIVWLVIRLAVLSARDSIMKRDQQSLIIRIIQISLNFHPLQNFQEYVQAKQCVKNMASIVNEKPPVWLLLKMAFPKADLDRVVVAFGNKIYVPFGSTDLSGDLIAHEETHLKQQKHSAAVAWVWWQKYIISKSFRRTQELEAYRVQYQYLRRWNKHEAHAGLLQMVRDFSSEMYGNIITADEALKLIKQ